MLIYNTLTRTKEDFQPQGEVIHIYVCGVTPYGQCHIGHAMSYIFFDVLRRYLKFKGYRLRHIQNFTDIDDKIINRARQLGRSPEEVARENISSYFRDMDALRIERADFYPRVTEEIPEIQEVIGGLISRGYAYRAGDSVYFRVKSFSDYGRLSHPDLSGQEMRASEASEEGKEHPLDFALWKASRPGEPFWESPWGRGRPGWHIECTAMALRYLGPKLDIHGGGQDLIFPHHENEIAQSECFTGQSPFARYWIHNGMVLVGEEKMSKSLGNLITVEEALSRFSANAIRLMVLSSHYRSPLKYSEESLLAMEKGGERLLGALKAPAADSRGNPLPIEPFRQRFIEAMDDDLNTPQALAALFELSREINRGAAERMDLQEAQQELRGLLSLLGIVEEGKAREKVEAAPFIELLASLRQEMREKKEWERADWIRQQLKERGIILEDTPEGTRWREEK